MVQHLPRIIEFLGYNPERVPEALHEWIAHCRRQLGMSQERFARILEIDPVTLYRWEKGLSVPVETKVAQMEALLSASDGTKIIRL
jgi:DNA-binding transcriptional regulator YiaG